jgi:hypothetical protein
MKHGHTCTLNGHAGQLLPASGLRVHTIDIVATAYVNGHVMKLCGFMPTLAALSVRADGEPVAITTFSRS